MSSFEIYGGESKERYRRSIELGAGAIEEIPEGASSNYRGRGAYAPYPMVFIDHASGAVLTDVDGNEYIDLHAGISSIILGHCMDAQLEVVRDQLERGSYFATAHELEYETAKLLNDLVPTSDRANFFSTGTEAVMYAIQLARAYTGKDKVLKFEGMYHGTSEFMLINVHPSPGDLGSRSNAAKIPETPGIPTRVLDCVETAPWNDLEVVERKLEADGDEIAAVITEALMSNSGILWPEEGYLEGLQQLAREYGVLFILDEVITGFRMGLHGAQGHFGLEPDLSIFGKSLGNGYPCSAVCGGKEVMDFVGVAPDKANFAGTFSGNPLAVAGVRGNLEALADLGGSGYRSFNRKGERLCSGLRDVLDDANEDAFIPRFAGFSYLHFIDEGAQPATWCDWRDIDPNVDRERYTAFASTMMDEGVFLPPKNDRINLMHAHTNEHVDIILEAAKLAASRLE